MIRQWVIYMLTALIALQSVVAMADSHQLHQSGNAHLTFEHEHDSSGVESAADKRSKTTASTKINAMDCHHCCHCHGSGGYFLGGSQNNQAHLSLNRVVSDYQFSYRSETESPDSPPPIV